MTKTRKLIHILIHLLFYITTIYLLNYYHNIGVTISILYTVVIFELPYFKTVEIPENYDEISKLDIITILEAKACSRLLFPHAIIFAVYLTFLVYISPETLYNNAPYIETGPAMYFMIYTIYPTLFHTELYTVSYILKCMSNQTGF